MLNTENIYFENAEITFKNFSGRPTKYQRQEGFRTFSVVVDDPDMAQRLSEDGWNVRILRPRNEEDTPRHVLDVSINFNFWKKPEIYMICDSHKTKLDEEDLDILDGADIVTSDIVVRPRLWDDNGTTRIKAYLQELYVTIHQSRFAAKYADM
mgnify:FL=1